MTGFPFKKELSRDFSNSEDLESFILESPNAADLLKKEIDVNQAEQGLLQDRIRTMEGLINDLPSYDPEYSALITQVQMDKIEFDELKRREEFVVEQLKKIS